MYRRCHSWEHDHFTVVFVIIVIVVVTAEGGWSICVRCILARHRLPLQCLNKIKKSMLT